jgi:hypothetical protein
MKKFFSIASLSKKIILLTERMPLSILIVVGLAALAFINIYPTGSGINYR